MPRELKVLRGNPGKRRLPPPVPAPAGAPACPPHLQGEARKEWRRLVRELRATGLLSKLDRGVLALYCQAWERWIEAERRLREAGPVVSVGPAGVPQVSPWFSVAHREMETVRKLLSELGLSPSARARVGASVQREEADPLLELVRRQAGG